MPQFLKLARKLKKQYLLSSCSICLYLYALKKNFIISTYEKIITCSLQQQKDCVLRILF